MKNRFGKVALAMATGAACLLFAGCSENQRLHGRKLLTKIPHNLEPFDCSKDPGENYEIRLVAGKQVLKSEKDANVFVCPNDTLTWTVDDPTFSIDITFRDSYADELFGQNNSHIPSGVGQVKSQSVRPSAAAHVAYKYDLVISKGSTSYPLDPHVIPVGN